MSFFECEFPTTLSYRAIGGPGFSTSVNAAFSGYEQRNKNWAASRSKWHVSLTTPSEFGDDRQHFADLLQAFFLNVNGRGDAFRLKDHKDYSALAQTLGIGNGSVTAFQLTKTYVAGGRSYVRTVTKPIGPPAVDYRGALLPQTVKVYLNGVIQSSGWSVNCTTGIVTFASAPGSGVVVTADFQFHFPVRFDTDDFEGQIEESDVSSGPLISWNSVTLIEVRPPY